MFANKREKLKSMIDVMSNNEAVILASACSAHIKM
jgi:hypothetical protein